MNFKIIGVTCQKQNPFLRSWPVYFPHVVFCKAYKPERLLADLVLHSSFKNMKGLFSELQFTNEKIHTRSSQLCRTYSYFNNSNLTALKSSKILSA